MFDQQQSQPSAQTLAIDEIVQAIDDGFTALARMLPSRERMEAMLFGEPDEVV